MLEKMKELICQMLQSLYESNPKKADSYRDKYFELIGQKNELSEIENEINIDL